VARSGWSSSTAGRAWRSSRHPCAATACSTFVSHSSVSFDERKQAESAFSQGSNCVIVATSTLELGIDVGDLDRVIQLDAPGSVASLLQRLGRTGRRPGTLRNCLFLTTSDDGFLRAAGLLDLWARGYVEPIEPPATPYHLFAQQIMALAMQTGGLVRKDWPLWIGSVPCFAAMGDEPERILDHMLATGVLHEDQGKIWFGAEGEKKFGYKNFLELFSVFTTPPLFTVLHGRTELGLVHDATFLGAGKEGQSVLLLGGRSWAVTSIDWRNRRAYVAPALAGGKSRWCGGSRSLHFEHARAIRRLLASGSLAGIPSQRAKDALDNLRNEMTWVDDQSTAIVRDSSGETQWWTFAGLRTNAMLAVALGDLVSATQVQDNLALPLRGSVRAEDVRQRLSEVDVSKVLPPVSRQALDDLKFGSCLPQDLAVAMLGRRAAEAQALRAVVDETVRTVKL
jgi:ATP-dependent Lhr-like helicase